MTKEVWKRIPGFSRYEVSNQGKIRSLSYKGTSVTKELSPVVGMDGYYKVSIYDERGVRKTLRVNRLVLLAFKGESSLQASHLDGNRLNNKLTNLTWESSSQNHFRKIQHGTDSKGERNSKARLTEDAVREIRRLYATGLMDGVQLAKKFRIAHTAIYAIISRKRWGHVT